MIIPIQSLLIKYLIEAIVLVIPVYYCVWKIKEENMEDIYGIVLYYIEYIMLMSYI